MRGHSGQCRVHKFEARSSLAINIVGLDNRRFVSNLTFEKVQRSKHGHKATKMLRIVKALYVYRHFVPKESKNSQLAGNAIASFGAQTLVRCSLKSKSTRKRRLQIFSDL